MAASTPARPGPVRPTPWPLLLGLALLLGAGSAGWWLGNHQRSTTPSPNARLEREVASLRQRFHRGNASPADQQRLLELLVALERQQEAIALLEPLADREPDRWALRLMLAELRRDRGDRAGAERELRMILSRRSDQMEALQLMTLLQLERGRGSQAEAQVRRAYETAVRPPVRPQALGLGLLLAELQQKRGQTDAATTTYRQLASEFPQDQRPLVALALLRHELADRPGALAALNEARQRALVSGLSDPRLDRLAAGWGLEPLRAASQAAAGPGKPAGPQAQGPATGDQPPEPSAAAGAPGRPGAGSLPAPTAPATPVP